MIFISSPYSHPDPWVREDRYYQVGTFAAHMEVVRGVTVYSPIAMWHVLAKEHKMPTDFAFWRRHNHHMLGLAAGLWVLKLDGWENSVGVADEIKFFNAYKGDPYISYFNGTTFQEEGRDG